MNKLLLLIIACALLGAGCTQEDNYPRQNKEREQYDIVFGGTGTETPEMFTVWFEPKTDILHLNLENICEHQRTPSEHTYVNYQSIEWTGTNPCEEDLYTIPESGVYEINENGAPTLIEPDIDWDNVEPVDFPDEEYE